MEGGKQAHLNGKGSKDDECDGGGVGARGVAQQCHPQPGRGLVEEQTPDAATHAPPADKHREQPVVVPTHTRQVRNGWSTGVALGHSRGHAPKPLRIRVRCRPCPKVQTMPKVAQLMQSACRADSRPQGNAACRPRTRCCTTETHLRPIRSEKTPPIGLAIKLRVPKMAARLPALVTLKLKLLPR